ncbi:hypothetical protein SEPCBS119000_006406 [Sporothrix epigloea]|uniref:Peptidase A1 domain-containing protein n=1 Tax=Sporothrix epigloea TaxID=1892477 RepID=A0ABP0E652_9PEZI
MACLPLASSLTQVQAVKHEPLDTHVKGIASRLAKKHGLEDHAKPASTVHERDNNFALVSAATPAASNAVGIDQDGTDFSYFIQAEFGSAKTPMLMLLDTGAGTTWVMGSDCASSACTMHNSFGPADSKTLQTSDETFSIAYGSGKVAGNLASDTFTVTSDLSLKMSFGIANTTSDDFTQFPFDGILGLSLREGATDNFWKTVKAATILAQNIFGVALWRDADGGPNTGEIIFGATDSTKYTGSIAYTSVDPSADGDWAIAMDDIGYSGVKAGITQRLAYIDTGTTYVFGPAADVATLHAKIPGAVSADGGTTYTVPCSSNQPLSVYFSGITYNISSVDWLSPASNAGGNCTSNIYGHAVVADAWLLGDLFIKNVYAVFDVDQSRIGFAKRAASNASPAPGSTTPSSGKGSTSAVSSVLSVVSATMTPSSSSAPAGDDDSSLPGLSSHETAGTVVAKSSSAALPKSTIVTSPASHTGSAIYVSVACVVAAIAMVASF